MLHDQRPDFSDLHRNDARCALPSTEKSTTWNQPFEEVSFLLRAQMPEPQPAWAQSYDRNMQPAWDRAFEPPAITSLESQHAIETLLLLYRRTGDRKFLEPIPSALDYLRQSRLEDGKLARFYELRSNRPLYFTDRHQMTYDMDSKADHYQFVVNSRLESITLRYRMLEAMGSDVEFPKATQSELAAQARRIIADADRRGAWTERGWVRDSNGRKVEPVAGIIQTSTFIENVSVLSQFLRQLD